MPSPSVAPIAKKGGEADDDVPFAIGLGLLHAAVGDLWRGWPKPKQFILEKDYTQIPT